MSPLLTIDTTQTGGPGHSTRPRTSPQGEFTCSKISLAFKTVDVLFATFPGTTVGSLARASSPNIRIRRSPSWTKTLLGQSNIWNLIFSHHLELLSGKVFVPHLGEKEGDCSWVDHSACRVVRRDRTLSAKKCKKLPKSDFLKKKNLWLTVHPFQVHGCCFRPQLTPDRIKSSHARVAAADMDGVGRKNLTNLPSAWLPSWGQEVPNLDSSLHLYWSLLICTATINTNLIRRSSPGHM